MKYRYTFVLMTLLLFPFTSSASHVSEEAKQVITYKISSLKDEIEQCTQGRTYFPPNRSIVGDEVLVLKKILTEAKFPKTFCWHRNSMVSNIIGVIGELPESFYKDENPTGRLFNYSVPKLNLESLKSELVPEFDMVLRYIDPSSAVHYFAITLGNNKYIG